MEHEEFKIRLAEISDKVLSKALTPDEEANYSEIMFEAIKHVNEYGQEFWYARELQVTLEYTKWDNFYKVIKKAMEACEGSNMAIADHFAEVRKMVEIGSDTTREIVDIQLSRYACYLIVQNGDPRKKVIALGQTYFAVKTRQQELIDNYDRLTENQKRLAIRREMKEHNKQLVAAAKDAGVKTSFEYAIFQNAGYKGLYGGLTAKTIGKRKGLKANQNILDHMGYEELAANLFRATQTEAKLRRENIQGKEAANEAHYEVGSKVRQTIKELGGTMPENLPTPDKSIRELEKEERGRLK